MRSIPSQWDPPSLRAVVSNCSKEFGAPWSAPGFTCLRGRSGPVLSQSCSACVCFLCRASELRLYLKNSTFTGRGQRWYDVDHLFSQNGRASLDIILPLWVMVNDLGTKLLDSSHSPRQLLNSSRPWFPQIRNRDKIHVPHLSQMRNKGTGRCGVPLRVTPSQK